MSPVFPIDAAGPYHRQCDDFRRALLTAAVVAAGGSRTLAARRLGIQRTYLLRLIRQLSAVVPPPPTAAERRRRERRERVQPVAFDPLDVSARLARARRERHAP